MKYKYILIYVVSALTTSVAFAENNDTIPQETLTPVKKKFTHEIGVHFAPLIFSGWGGNNTIYFYKLYAPSGKIAFRTNISGDYNAMKRDMIPNNQYMNEIPSNLKYSNDLYNSITAQLGVQHRLKYFDGNHALEVFCFEGLILGSSKNESQSLYAVQLHQVSGEPKAHLDKFQITSYSSNVSTTGIFAGFGVSYTIFPHVKFTLETSIFGQSEKTTTSQSKKSYTEALNGFYWDGNTESLQNTTTEIFTMQLRPLTYLYLAYSF